MNDSTPQSVSSPGEHHMQRAATLTSLPTELITQVLTFLTGHDLAYISQTCRLLHDLASDTLLWHALVSTLRIRTPAPYASYKDLYISLHRHLWLHGKVWFSDRHICGNIVLGHYAAASGKIELVNLVASKHGPASHVIVHELSTDPDVLVSEFTPLVRRWDRPVMELGKESIATNGQIVQRGTPVNGNQRVPEIVTSLIRALPSGAAAGEQSTSSSSPRTVLWPPEKILAGTRSRPVPPQNDGPSPQATADATDLFRLRKWMMFSSLAGVPTRGVGVHLGMNEEAVETFAALDPALYTPDATHPLRGLWAGDYSTHGVEIVLFHQPMPRALEGIKITGDGNVPRGEHTFLVPDLKDVRRIAEETEWAGAEVVPARGQGAGDGFQYPQFVNCQFIMIGKDEVAMYWDSSSWGAPPHISRFLRLDMDRLIYGNGVIDFRETEAEKKKKTVNATTV